MKIFDPPIEKRSTDELIIIANSNSGDWQNEAVEQAKSELLNREISIEKQKAILEKWSEEEKEAFEKIESEHQEQLKRNEAESYSIFKMILIFFFSPYILLRRWKIEYPLNSLKEGNFKIKYKQRLILLITGTIFYSILIIGAIKYHQYKWKKEIENADIRNWEKNQVKK